MLTGRVEKGRGIGSTINFPTANINIKESYKLIPHSGVYLIKAMIKDVYFFGMMNIGNNPTVSEDKRTNIEVHFFDFNNDIYGEVIKVELLDYLRNEIKFPSVLDLKEQLKKDEINAKRLIDLISKI